MDRPMCKCERCRYQGRCHNYMPIYCIDYRPKKCGCLFDCLIFLLWSGFWGAAIVAVLCLISVLV